MKTILVFTTLNSVCPLLHMCIELKWPNILSDFFLGLLVLSLPAGLHEVHYSQAENRFFAPQGQLVAPIPSSKGNLSAGAQSTWGWEILKFLT